MFQNPQTRHKKMSADCLRLSSSLHLFHVTSALHQLQLIIKAQQAISTSRLLFLLMT